MGRPKLEFDTERAGAVIYNLTQGDLLDVACRRAGVSWSTVRRWRMSEPDFDWEVRVACKRSLSGGSVELSSEVFNEKVRISKGIARRPWPLVDAAIKERARVAEEHRADLIETRPDPTAAFGSTFDPTRPETAF